MIEKSFLPKWRIERLISERRRKRAFQRLHPAREIDSFFVKANEKMKMIWHDDVSAGKRSKYFARLRKFDESRVDFLRREKGLSVGGATGDEIDRCALKNQSKAAQALGHNPLVAAVSDRRNQLDSTVRDRRYSSERSAQIDDSYLFPVAGAVEVFASLIPIFFKNGCTDCLRPRNFSIDSLTSRESPIA
jgi:hypothetical protein